MERGLKIVLYCTGCVGGPSLACTAAALWYWSIVSKRILIAGDIHFPSHSRHAIAEFRARAKAYKPDIFVQIGDMFDIASASRHDRAHSKPARVIDELKQSWPALDHLLSALPRTCKRYITLGNHDVRATRQVWRNAPALDGLFNLNDALGLTARGFHVTPYGQSLKLGKCYFTHDMGSAGATAGRQAMQRMQANVVIGHTHRLSIEYETNGKGRSHFGCVAGWLGDASKINYRHRELVKREWMLGWVEGTVSNDGSVRLSPVPLF